MNNDIDIPKIALKAFPILSKITFVSRLASPVPAVPDTIFAIFATNSGAFLALVTTDYANPQHQSQELKSISGQYGFEFTNLVKPHGENNEVIEILDNDIEGDFLIHEPYMNYRRYYYLANIK